MQSFQRRPKIGAAADGPPMMTRRRAVSIRRRWSSYDSETLATAEQVIRATAWPRASSLSPGAFPGLMIMLAALVGLLGIARFLGVGQ